MAQPTRVIKPMEVDTEAVRAKELRELEDQLIMHKDTLLKLFRLMDQLNDHEMINAANAALAESDPILTRVLKAVNETETDKAIRNALLLVQGLGKFKFDEIEPMILKFNKGLKLSTEYDNSEPQGWLGLLRVLTNRDFVEGSIVLTKFVKGFGSPVEQLKEEQGIVSPIETNAGDLKNVRMVETPSEVEKQALVRKSDFKKERVLEQQGNVRLVGIAAGAAAVLTVGAMLLRK